MGWFRRLIGISLVATVALPGASAATSKKTPARKIAPAPRYPSPRVSAKVRADALRRVSKYLGARPANPIQRAGALVPFFELLSRKIQGGSDSVHILHFGDSHTAADEWTGQLRASLQKEFGDGGAGFSFPGQPFNGYRRLDLRGGASKQWETLWLRSGNGNGNGDGLYGLGGVSIATDSKSQSVYLETDCERLEVFYLQQPGGGKIALYEDGAPVRDLSTDGELAPAFLAYQTARGPHRFEVRTLEDAPVRLFGWVTENARGVTYESMGINGAEAPWILRWREDMLASYIQRRDPALIVLAYGSNEASDSQWTLESYQSAFSELLQRLRRAAPTASILVVGPPDRLQRVKRRWQPLDKLDVIIAAQKEACRLNGCAFWDTRARMGGKGSMLYWAYAGLAQGDYVHFTAVGYRRLAEALFQDIIQDFAVFRRAAGASPDQVNNGPTSQNH